MNVVSLSQRDRGTSSIVPAIKHKVWNARHRSVGFQKTPSGENVLTCACCCKILVVEYLQVQNNYTGVI